MAKSIFFIIIFGLIISSCKKAEIPVLITAEVTDVTENSAICGGIISSDGTGSVISRGVCWSTGDNPSILDSKTTDDVFTWSFTSHITGLDGGTTYYVRAYATNITGTGYGAVISFTTLGQVPDPNNSGATEISTTSAILNGTVNPNYLSTVVDFEYGTTTSYGTAIKAVQSPVTGNTIINVSADITGLSPGTTYHYRIKAVNSLGTTYGNDLSFTTLGQVPTVETLAATDISNKATLNGIVNANHLSTIVTFDYGVTTDYGYTATATQSPVTGHSPSSVSVSITGLAAIVTFHYRMKAENSLGTVYGNDMSFTTITEPSVITNPVSSIQYNSAICGGSIISDGGGTITSKGVCWNTTGNPTISDNKTNEGSGTGTFVRSLTLLSMNTTYYIRAYAANSAGTAYGDQFTFTTGLTDVEGNMYKTVDIGGHIWMAENLRTSRYCNGDLIGSDNQWSYDNNESNTSIYGRLYTWYAIADSRKVCPEGWRVPSDNHWEYVVRFLDPNYIPYYFGKGSAIAGGKLKEAGTAHWNSPNTGATNETGFTALPAGSYITTMHEGWTFSGLGEAATWWSSTTHQFYETVAWVRGLSHTDGAVNRVWIYKGYGFSVRCIKD